MADRFVDQAAAQVDPIYQQQTTALQNQIPELQNYYTMLSQGLQQQNQQQLTSGVNQIVEDANARGVLRSTLPNDARSSLTAQLGAALNQSLGQLGHQQAQDYGNIQTQIAGLGSDRLKMINDIAGSLYNRDLQDRQFQYQQQQDQLQYQLELKKLAASRAASASSGPTISQFVSSLLSEGFYGDNTRNGWTENYAAPRVAAAFGISKPEALNYLYNARKVYETQTKKK